MYDVWLAGWSGAVFWAGTTELCAEIMGGLIVCDDRYVKSDLEHALGLRRPRAKKAKKPAAKKPPKKKDSTSRRRKPG